MKNLDINTNQFWRDGYLVLKNAFSKEEIEQLREKAIEDRDHGNPQADLLNKDDVVLNKIITNTTIVEVASKLLGKKTSLFW